MPLQDVQTKDPIVVLTYVGPLCPQSKHFLLWGWAARSRRSFKFFSSCFFFTEAIMDVCSASVPRTAQVYQSRLLGRGRVVPSGHAICSRKCKFLLLVGQVQLKFLWKVSSQDRKSITTTSFLKLEMNSLYRKAFIITLFLEISNGNGR